MMSKWIGDRIPSIERSRRAHPRTAEIITTTMSRWARIMAAHGHEIHCPGTEGCEGTPDAPYDARFTDRSVAAVAEFVAARCDCTACRGK